MRVSSPPESRVFNTMAVAVDHRSADEVREFAEAAASAEGAFAQRVLATLSGDARAEALERHRAIRAHLTALARLGGFTP